MKKLIVLIASLLLLALLAPVAYAVEPIDLSKSYARMGAVMVGGGSAAAATCSTSTDLIGTTDTSGSAASITADTAQCILFTATCPSGCSSGNLSAAYIRHTNTSAYSAKVCVYTYDSDAPDAGDLKVGCSANITGTTANNWDTASISGAITCGSQYFVCVFADNDSANALAIDSDSSSITLYYQSTSGRYDDEPANMTGTWNTATVANRSYYVTIGP